MTRHEAQFPTADTIQSLNEFELIISHRECLAIENYRGCADLKAEVLRRVKAGILNHVFACLENQSREEGAWGYAAMQASEDVVRTLRLHPLL